MTQNMIHLLKKIKRFVLERAQYRAISAKEVKSMTMRGGGKTADIMLLSHALEKGMGISNVKDGYGQKKAEALLDKLKEAHEEARETYVYREGYSVLKAYLSFQDKSGIDLLAIKNGFKALPAPENLEDAGYRLIEKAALEEGEHTGFDKLIYSRHSLRKGSDEPITESEMQKALLLAGQAPSACNRQPWKIYYSLNQPQNKKLSQLVPGNKGFADDIPYYAVITVDRGMFGGTEIYQWFINGGIFTAYFTLALHSLGIGSCVFQWPDFYKDEKKVRRLTGIRSGSEAIICIIGYGKYPDQMKCICAARKPVSEIAAHF